MDELKTKIDLVPLSDETIKHSSYLPNDLWMVQVTDGKALGPYHTRDLKEYAHKYQYLFEHAKVYNLESDEWKEMFALTQFQRRKPQLVSAHNLMDNQEFYIIFQGQKNGPHGQEKIQQLLDDNKITTSTQLSLDKGRSWIKLYEHHVFDRRSKKPAGDLPAKPSDNVLIEVLEQKDKILEHNQVTDEMLVELSLMKKRLKNKERVTKSKSKRIAQKVESATATMPKTSSGKGLKYSVSAGVFALLLVVAFNFSENSNMSKFRAEVPTEIKSIDNSARDLAKRVPASVKPTRKVRPAARKPVVPRYRAIKRRPAATKPAKPQTYKETFEQDIENIDINDPNFQDELTRQLANDEDEGFYEEEPMPRDDDAEFYPEDAQQFPLDGMDNEEYPLDEPGFPQEEPEYGDVNRDFDPEERVEHEVE